MADSTNPCRLCGEEMSPGAIAHYCPNPRENATGTQPETKSDFDSFMAGFKAAFKVLGHDWLDAANNVDQAFASEWFEFKERKEDN